MTPPPEAPLVCPICGAGWQPGVSRWAYLDAAAGCRPARVWRHTDPRTLGRRNPQRCAYIDAEAIVDPYAPPGVARGVRAEGKAA